jgi:CAAX protease family protein
MTKPAVAGQTTPNGILKGPNGLRAAWRLLIYAALLIAFGYSAFKLAEHMLHSQTPDAASPVFGLVYCSILLSVVLSASWIMARIEGRNLAVYALPWRRAFCGQFWHAAAIGLVSLMVLLGVLWLSGFYSLGSQQVHGAEIWTNALLWAATVIVAAIVEEFFYRGYLQFTLTSGIGFWPAALVTSSLMAWMHHFNPGWTWLGLATVGGFGLIACLLLRRTGDLWMPIGLHAGWNYGEVYVFGVPSSGLMGNGHLFQGSFHGPSWATGMPFGVEAGWPNVALFLIWWFLIAKFLRDVKYPIAQDQAKTT